MLLWILCINLYYNIHWKHQTGTWAIRSLWAFEDHLHPSCSSICSISLHATIQYQPLPHGLLLSADIDLSAAVVRGNNWQPGCLPLSVPAGSSCQLKTSIRLQPAFVSPPTRVHPAQVNMEAGLCRQRRPLPLRKHAGQAECLLQRAMESV